MRTAAEAASVVPIGFVHALVVATCALALIFCVYYTVRMPWWQTQMGWNLFIMSACLGLFTLPSTVAFLVGIDVTSAFFQWFIVICFSVVPLLEVHRIWLLWRAPDSHAPAGSSAGSVTEGQLPR